MLQEKKSTQSTVTNRLLQWMVGLCLIVVASTTFAFGTVKNNLDFPGFDLGARLSGVATALACNYLCADTNGCVAYTWIDDFISSQFPAEDCFLKHTLPAGDGEDTPRSELVSGVVQTNERFFQLRHVGFNGSDLSGQQFHGVGGEAFCAERCRVNDACAAYTYLEASDSCLLKSAVVSASPDSGRMAGVKVTSSGAEVKNVKLNIDTYKVFASANLEQCKALCAADAQCRGYTHDFNAVQCQLKKSTVNANGQSIAVHDARFTSGVMVKNKMQMSVGFDMYGGDLSGRSRYDVDGIAECELDCLKNTSCVALVYRDSDKKCWLKNELKETTSNATLLVGVKQVNGQNPPSINKSRPGGDMDNMPIIFPKDNPNVRAYQCQDECLKQSACRAFTYHEDTGSCYLKDTLTALKSASNTVVGTKTPEKPRLLVVTFIDQGRFNLKNPRRENASTDYKPYPGFGVTDAMNKFVNEGTSYDYALYEHAQVYTPQGHQTVSTGGNPWRHGNDVPGTWSVTENTIVVDCFDKDHIVWNQHITITAEKYENCSSPRRFIRNWKRDNDTTWKPITIADSVKKTSPDAKIFGVAGWDTPLNNLMGDAKNNGGKAFWVNKHLNNVSSSKFTSSTYYYPGGIPTWAKNFKSYYSYLKDDVVTNNGLLNLQRGGGQFTWNLKNPLSSYANKNYQQRGNPGANALTYTVNGQSTSLTGANGTHTFPHYFPDTEQNAVTLSLGLPFSDMYAFEFAKELVVQENLGNEEPGLADDRTDLLYLYMGSLDQISHEYGANSTEYEETWRLLNYTLGNFMEFLEERLGRENVLMVVTSDHGVDSIPEYMASTEATSAEYGFYLGKTAPTAAQISNLRSEYGRVYLSRTDPSGAMNVSQLANAAINDTLGLGEGATLDFVRAFEASNLLLDKKLLAKQAKLHEDYPGTHGYRSFVDKVVRYMNQNAPASMGVHKFYSIPTLWATSWTNLPPLKVTDVTHADWDTRVAKLAMSHNIRTLHISTPNALPYTFPITEMGDAGEIFIMASDHRYIYGGESYAAMHATPSWWDQAVLLGWWGNNVARSSIDQLTQPARERRMVRPRDIVPTIGAILGVATENLPLAGKVDGQTLGKPLAGVIGQYGETSEYVQDPSMLESDHFMATAPLSYLGPPKANSTESHSRQRRDGDVGATNVALGKTATQSTTGHGGVASRGVDGNTSGEWANSSITHTNQENQPWWELDLGANYDLKSIKLYNRTNCCGERLTNLRVFVSDVPFTSKDLSTTQGQSGVLTITNSGTVGTSAEFDLTRTGRYIRVQLANNNSILSLAEVEVMGIPTGTVPPPVTNVALGKSTKQSTTGHGGIASRGVDGNTSGDWANSSITHTHRENQPWWEVDLGANYELESIKLYNRTNCCGDRLTNFRVFVSDVPFTSTNISTTQAQSGVLTITNSGTVGTSTEFDLARTGRYVRVQLANNNSILSLAEVEVTGSLNGIQPPPPPPPPPAVTNVALGKTAKQSTTAHGGIASRGVDGNTSGHWDSSSITHTHRENQPWWEVDLGEAHNLDTIKIYNRTNCCGDRLTNYRVFVSDVPFTSTDVSATQAQSGVLTISRSGTVGTSVSFDLGGTGRYIRIQLANNNSILSLAEVEVMGATAASATWVHCASENETCSFSGQKTVRYGANGRFKQGVYRNGVLCANVVFGDPAHGVRKSCEYLSQ